MRLSTVGKIITYLAVTACLPEIQAVDIAVSPVI